MSAFILYDLGIGEADASCTRMTHQNTSLGTLHPLYEVMWDEDFFRFSVRKLVIVPTILRSYDPTIYVHETALSIASEHCAYGSLSERSQVPRQDELSKDLDEAPHEPIQST